MKESTKGRPIAVLASGPSLTASDIDLLRSAGVPFVAVNTTWEIARDCCALVAGDYRWWKAHGKQVDIETIKISRSPKAKKTFSTRTARSKIKGGYNSAMVAAEWCVQKGYGPVILLGVDCSLKNGVHHHGPHTKTPDPDRARLHHWPRQWKRLREAYPRAEIVNCSRHTELDTFPKRELEHVLCALG